MKIKKLGRRLFGIQLLVLTLIFSLSACESESSKIDYEAEILALAEKHDIDLRISNDVDPNNSIVFDNIKTAEQFITSFKGNTDISPKQEIIGSRCRPKNRKVRTSTSITPLANMNFAFTLQDNGNVSNFSSYLSGVTIGLSWENATHEVEHTVGGTEIHVNGSIEYDLFYQGVGSLGGSPVDFKILITCSGETYVYKTWR